MQILLLDNGGLTLTYTRKKKKNPLRLILKHKVQIRLDIRYGWAHTCNALKIEWLEDDLLTPLILD